MSQFINTEAMESAAYRMRDAAIEANRAADALEREMQRAEAAEAAVEQLEGALEAGQRNCDDAYDDLRAERDEAKRLAAQLAAQLADCAGYIASVRTDRQITREGDVYALQTLEWAEGAVEVAQYANAALEAYDKALNNGESST
jgi:chromosome segregation ATPase